MANEKVLSSNTADHAAMPRIWREIVWEAVLAVADEEGYFTIHDLRPRFQAMAAEKPRNPFVAEKVRQQLQILRDRGLVLFLTPGSYRIAQATESSPP